MAIKNRILRRIAAGAGAVALAVAGSVAMGGVANAAVGPDQPNAPATGTLTINKYEGATGNTTKPLNGITFTATTIGIKGEGGACGPLDLKVAANWDDIDGLFSQANTGPVSVVDPFCKLTTTFPGTTGAAGTNGQAVLTLPVGVYLVQETSAGTNPVVSKVPDFFVSIPTSEGATKDGWNYNVVANPKNQVVGAPSKTIVAAQPGDQLVIGKDVTWNLTVPVPTLNNAEKFADVIITDTLDSRLSLVANSSVVKVGAVDLAQGTDYNVTGNAVWTLTETGRGKLDSNMDEDLTISFKTTVNSVGDGQAINSNYNSSFKSSATGATPTVVPGTDAPRTYWGQLAILKTDNSAPVLNLKGAEFKVFPTATDGSCPTAAPTTGAIATGTSDANGVVQWDGQTVSGKLGLWVTNSQDATPGANPTKDYCVYETKVPAGHTAVAFTTKQTVTAGEANINRFTVVNAKTQGPNLPLTGAGGTLALTIGGLVIIAIGGTFYAVSRKRRSAAVEAD